LMSLLVCGPCVTAGFSLAPHLDHTTRQPLSSSTVLVEIAHDSGSPQLARRFFTFRNTPSSLLRRVGQPRVPSHLWSVSGGGLLANTETDLGLFLALTAVLWLAIESIKAYPAGQHPFALLVAFVRASHNRRALAAKQNSLKISGSTESSYAVQDSQLMTTNRSLFERKNVQFVDDSETLKTALPSLVSIQVAPEAPVIDVPQPTVLAAPTGYSLRRRPMIHWIVDSAADTSMAVVDDRLIPRAAVQVASSSTLVLEQRMAEGQRIADHFRSAMALLDEGEDLLNTVHRSSSTSHSDSSSSRSSGLHTHVHPARTEKSHSDGYWSYVKRFLKKVVQPWKKWSFV